MYFLIQGSEEKRNCALQFWADVKKMYYKTRIYLGSRSRGDVRMSFFQSVLNPYFIRKILLSSFEAVSTVEKSGECNLAIQLIQIIKEHNYAESNDDNNVFYNIA